MLDPVVNLCAFEDLGAGHPESPRLKSPDPGRNDHGAGVENGAVGRFQTKASRIELLQPLNLGTQMKLRLERLDLLQQAVDELLCATDRQRWDVVDRLVRIELGALAAGRLQ